MIQSHLKKLFAGIHNVAFDEGYKNIVAMKSLDGEVVPLKKPVTITPEVEVGSLILFEVSVNGSLCRTRLKVKVLKDQKTNHCDN